jgi:hypothetical protein
MALPYEYPTDSTSGVYCALSSIDEGVLWDSDDDCMSWPREERRKMVKPVEPTRIIIEENHPSSIPLGTEIQAFSPSLHPSCRTVLLLQSHSGHKYNMSVQVNVAVALAKWQGTG